MPDTGQTLMILLTAAWLLPLVGFVIEIYWLRWSHRLNGGSGVCAVGMIATSFVCSLASLLIWMNATEFAWFGSVDHRTAGTEQHAAQVAGEGASSPSVYSGTYYELARFGDLRLSLEWYIDGLTLVMFTMITFVATCIHLFSIGYMRDELTEEFEDHEVRLRDGQQFGRPGRFHRFFAYMSLFCFSMLGLVIAGTIFQVFIFWELVGLCSYLLIGFYSERKSASTAANKAFIMNRVGDFGFLIGLMIIWTAFGTFQFADSGRAESARPGLFTMLRGHDGKLDVAEDGKAVYLRDASGHRLEANGRERSISYVLLVAAGIGIFAGCVGKSAQFPLQTWLPDAMEGPTPVSALVHSATMVAAGVYLAGRFYPMFTPEVLLGIAYIGCITLFVAATIAIVVTDIKRVLAYSTISQLGYMMLAIGVGGWGAALFHLLTHAFFKSLMFLGAGSVIAGCHHVQDMKRMGGLRHKMKITAATMFVGVVAIAGLAIPGTSLGLSGFYSKDAVIASALAYTELNSSHFLLFVVPLFTAGLTSFYMFRLWFMTFAGQPRDRHVYDHCRESPRVMTVPLLLLAVLAAGSAVGGESGPLYRLVMSSEVVPAVERVVSSGAIKLTLPSHDGHASDVHKVHSTAAMLALIASFVGLSLAYVMYVQQSINPADLRRQFPTVYDFLVDKWRFDGLYDVAFVRPVRVISSWCARLDDQVLDGILHSAARVTVQVSHWDRKFDESMVDGIVNWIGTTTYSIGASLKVIQTGHLRQYVMWIGVGVVVLFAALFSFMPK